MSTMNDLVAAVAAQKSVEASLVELVGGMAEKIAKLSLPTTDSATQAAIDQLVVDVTANTAELAKAIAANTPAAPTA